MTRLDATLDNFPSLFKRQMQLNMVAQARVVGDPGSETLVFTQHDVFEAEGYGPLVIIMETEIGDNDIELTITYNAALTYDLTIPMNTDYDILITVPIQPYQITNIDFKSGTDKKGMDLDSMSLFNVTGNHGRMMAIHHQQVSEIRGIIYEFLRYMIRSKARDDWLDKLAESWGLVRVVDEADVDLLQRIVAKATSTDGTIASVVERVRTYLDLLLSDAITVTESYETGGWTLDESRLLAGGDSELILEGGVPIEAMQFIMTIEGYLQTLKSYGSSAAGWTNSSNADGSPDIVCATTVITGAAPDPTAWLTADIGAFSVPTEFTLYSVRPGVKIAYDTADDDAEYDIEFQVQDPFDGAGWCSGHTVANTTGEGDCDFTSWVSEACGHWDWSVANLESSNMAIRVRTSAHGEDGTYHVDAVRLDLRYTQTLSEADVEEYLRSVINVSASPIVRFSL